METMMCNKCETIFEVDQSDVEIICPKCGSNVTTHYMKFGSGKYNINFSMKVSLDIYRSVHMKYYQLANEMAYKCINSEERVDTVKYSLGTVLLSYTAIDCFVHNQTVVNDNINEIVNNFSEQGNDQTFIFSVIEQVKKILSKSSQPTTRNNFNHHGLINRIKMLYDEQHYPEKLVRGIPKIQRLKLLNDLRVQAVHYKPFPESQDKDLEENIRKLVKEAGNNFKLAEDQKDFLHVVYSPDCAKWSFNLIEEILNWFCDNFGINRRTFNPKYDIN